MKIPLIDLNAQYRSIQSEIDESIRKVLSSGHFILGPNVTAFEKEMADYLGVKYAIGVASGTDALILTLRALEIGPGDEVILPTYTFFATVEAVMNVGATPVCVDVQPDTYCMDIRHATERISAKTKAIIPVHLYGHPADMLPVIELARAHSLKIIEDNAQALGAEHHGRKTGSMGDVGCLSFFPSKNLGAYGDGGMVVSNDFELAEHVRLLRTHGWQKKYSPEVTGYNSRLDELQAAILRVKLNYLDKWNEQRSYLANQYTERLLKTGIGVPLEAPYSKHVYHLYIIRVKRRDEVQGYLKEEGISSDVYYPQPVHLTKPCRYLDYQEGSFPVSEMAAKETLAVPLYPEMSMEQLEKVVKALEHTLRTIGIDK